ncbi:MAG: alkaline phosphatase D family protein [Pacificimonas sp.]
MTKTLIAALVAGTMLAGCAVNEPPMRAGAAETVLPMAAPTPALDTSRVLTRIAFGSCNHQTGDQSIWSVMAAAAPDLTLLIGDNVYGDDGYAGDAAMASFVSAYRIQAADAGFSALRAAAPMLATWDDHDYGPNDSGGYFVYKQRSERLFESFWGGSADMRARPGVYDSVIAGPEGERVQVIMLDTRFFRGPLAEAVERRPRPALGKYVSRADPDAEMLGDAQWAWLERELAKPADLRILVSSIQLLTDAHGFEKWGNMPIERARLYRMLGARVGGGVIAVSGDRHVAGVYRDRPDALDTPLWELTSSSLNRPFATGDVSAREPDAKRKGPLLADENFGLIEIDWPARQASLQLRGKTGDVMLQQQVAF